MGGAPAGRATGPANTATAALPAGVVLPTGVTPTDYKMHLDLATDADDPDDNPNVKVIKSGNAITVATGPAATLWRDADKATGNYTLKGTFTMLGPATHQCFYGLIFGGKDLNLPTEQYLYFMVAQTGAYIIKWRRTALPADGANIGSEAPTIVPATIDDVVQKPDASGHSVNNLEVRVQGDKIDFVVNGKVVQSLSKASMMANDAGNAVRGQPAPAPHQVPVSAGTDGIYGFRISHVLPGITVENLQVVPGN
jgi:hypothetical protein